MKRTLFGFFVLLFAASCTQDVYYPEELGGIIGIVADKTTGEPVPVANVTLEPTGASTVTGSDGSFTFKNLQDGQYTVRLSKEGYKDNESSVQVTNGKTLESHFLIERIPAVLTIDRDVLDFGDNYSNTTLSFSMVNKNYVDLDWEIKYYCRWIKEVDPPNSITKLGYGKTQTVVVTIDRDALLAGDNETVMVVTTSDGASELTVKAIGQEKKLPTLNILASTDLKATSVVLHAELTDKGIPEYTERGFVLSDSKMPTKETATMTIAATVNAEKSFSVRVADLKLGATYHVRAYAVNEKGIAYSTNEDKFTTQAILPTVKTLSATSEDRETKSAVLRGSITDEGDPAYTERGFVWSTEYEVPTIEDRKIVVSGSGVGDYEKRFAFPSINKTIYVRAYATNTRGTAYGETVQIFQSAYIVLKELKLGVQRTDINDSTVQWKDANSMCNNSAIGGLNDWRLPTIDELFQLYNKKQEIGGFSEESTLSNDTSGYWSSNMHYSVTYGSNYYYYFLLFANGYSSYEVYYHKYRARCVRSLE